MKKLISALITASMLAASAVMPVFADYTAADFDVAEQTVTFDDGTATNAIDDSPAYKTGTEVEKVYTTTIDSTKNFFFTFDFCMDNGEGYITLTSDDSKNNVGPQFTYSGGNLRTQTGSSDYQTLGAISLNEWYRAEIEGVTGGAPGTTFRLYDKTGTLIKETTGFNFRNLASNGRHFSFLRGHDASIDNIKAVQLYPDKITISSDSDTVDAGQSLPLSYTMTRRGGAILQYNVTWSLYDETDTTEIVNDDTIKISEDGVIIPDISCPKKTVTVRATSVFGGKELIGRKTIEVNGVDTTLEPFDRATVSGGDSLKAGTSADFTFTASKNGSDVTESLTDDDVVWSIYNCDNVNPNNNKKISIENGRLTVADGVLPQDIYVRVSTKSGKVFGAKKITIEMSDSQKENVFVYNACEEAKDGTTRVDSIDGSTAYHTTTTVNFMFTDQENYVLTELDIKFGGEGSGFRIKRSDGDEASSFIMHSGAFSQQTGGSSFPAVYPGIDTDKWYHIEVLYKAATAEKADNVAINIYEWNDEGTSYERVHTATGLNDRNGKNYGRLEVQGDTIIDNIKIVSPQANVLDLKAPGTSEVTTVFAGETAQFSVTASRNGLPLEGSTILWEVRDEVGPIEGDAIKVDSNGLLTVSAVAPAGNYKVRASSGAMYAEAAIEVKVVEIFKVTNIGVNEEGDKIVRLYVDKDYSYDDEVTFIIAVKDANGVLKGLKLIKTFGDRLNIGKNEVTTDFDIPSNFNSETDKVEVMVWTTL